MKDFIICIVPAIVALIAMFIALYFDASGRGAIAIAASVGAFTYVCLDWHDDFCQEHESELRMDEQEEHDVRHAA